jgi:branched-chain amino acid transport system substrate-binding protein
MHHSVHQNAVPMNLLKRAAVLLACAACVAASPTTQPKSIEFGTSTVVSGPAMALGTNMCSGVEAALQEVNDAGGIHGQKAYLTLLDDGYEPGRTVPNMRKLVDKAKVLAIVGNVGTPTAIAAIPIANASKVPFFGAYTGAGVLRKDPPDHYVINFRASYVEETAAMVDALIGKAGLKPSEIAFFTQRDGYGDAGFAGGSAALKRYGLRDADKISHVRYERNTVAVEKSVADLLMLDPPPRAVIMVGAYAPCAAFIKAAKENDLSVIFLNVSSVGAEQLAAALGKSGDGVIVTQVVPHYDVDLPIAKDFRHALNAYDPSLSPTFGAMEGYISTRVLIKALQDSNEPVSRESIVTALESMGSFDLGLGYKMRLSPTEHQASHQVWPTVLRGGKIVQFNWNELSPKTASVND